MAQHEQRPIVALIYDFDGTLSPGNMQEYDFIPAVGKSNREFWEESNETAREQDGDPILAYMYRMLHEAKSSGKSLRYEAFVQSGAYRAVRRSARMVFADQCLRCIERA